MVVMRFESSDRMARASGMMQFKVADFKSSNIRVNGTFKADWIELPVEVPGRASCIKAECHCRGVQNQRCVFLGDYQDRKVASLGFFPMSFHG